MDNSQILKEIAVQIFGFAIVFLVLRKFAWGSILGMIDTRRQKIEDAFNSIEKKKLDLDNLEKDYRKKLENIEQEARAKIQEAANIGLSLAKDIQDKARVDAQKLIDRAKAEIDQEIAKTRLSMRDQLVDISALISEKIIQQKLDDKEHEKLVDQFIKELDKV